MCVRGGVALISGEVGVFRAHQTCLTSQMEATSLGLTTLLHGRCTSGGIWSESSSLNKELYVNRTMSTYEHLDDVTRTKAFSFLVLLWC